METIVIALASKEELTDIEEITENTRNAHQFISRKTKQYKTNGRSQARGNEEQGMNPQNTSSANQRTRKEKMVRCLKRMPKKTKFRRVHDSKERRLL